MSATEPRTFRPGYGWRVDLAHDQKAACAGCGASCYWVTIRTKNGALKPMILSEATAKEEGGHTFMSSHFADCPKAERFRK